MAVITNNEDLSQAVSGILNIPALEAIYERFVDTSLSGIAGSRIITLHLNPAITADVNTQSGNTGRAYNPFFGQPVRQPDSSKLYGVIPTKRDVQYTAHIRIGPMDLDANKGIGRLEENEAQTTTVIESLSHILTCRSATIDGLRYRLKEGPRTIGFSVKKYVMATWQRINEKEA